MKKLQLPIASHREEIIGALDLNQVLVVVGETGSGKTTQLPQFLYHAGYTRDGAIGMTEPRRIAATSVAEFVAESLGSEIGDLVGFKTRFEKATSQATEIKFMTDGILLREIQTDPELSRYSVIVVDEAHERSTNIDFLLGLLKDLLKRRSDLKVIVASATIDSKRFSDYFDGAPIVEVSGRTHPVEIVWGQSQTNLDGIMTQTAQCIMDIHRTKPVGDILAFFPGADEINLMRDELEHRLDGVVVLPAHGGLAPQDQGKIFQNFPGRRKIILATNIAETSITVDGVVYVVDTGLIKQTHYHPERGIGSLDLIEHSQAGCNQRAGRAGRTQPGICYRMYSKVDFLSRPQFTMPEIMRTGLASVVLSMESIGIEDVEGFDLIDPPARAAFHQAYETLISLGAIDPQSRKLTQIGEEMVHLPLEPRVARMVLEAEKHDCLFEVATVAAFLSVKNVFVRPKDKQYEADFAHSYFKSSGSDIATYMKVWREYYTNGFSRAWCFQKYLNANVLEEVRDIRGQILNIMMRRSDAGHFNPCDNLETVERAVASGLIQGLLFSAGLNSYAQVIGESFQEIFIHPSSAAFSSRPMVCVCTEMVRTTKLFARGISEVKAEWLPEIAPMHFCWGDPVMQKVVDDGVVTKYPVLHKGGRILGETTKVISFEEASAIQEGLIAQAEAKGYVQLVFEKRRNPYHGMEEFIVGNAKCGYEGLRPEEGVVYYGEIRKLTFSDDYRATAHLKVLPLPGTILQQTIVEPEEVEHDVYAQEEIPKSSNELKGERPASATDLQSLLGVFGPR